MMNIDIKSITRFCPTKEEIIRQNNIAEGYFNDLSRIIDEVFLSSNEEIFSYTCGDLWSFALVMGMCGRKYHNTNVLVSYIRSDGKNPPEIGFTNKSIKAERLTKELGGLEDKLSKLEYGSSKYIKMTEKIERIKEEIEKLK